MTHHKASVLLNSPKYVRITQNPPYKTPTFKKWYIGVFCGTAQISQRHLICYKLICSEIKRKVSDPTSCHGDVNVVLTHILDPTWKSQRHCAGEEEEGDPPPTLSKTLIFLQAAEQLRWNFRVSIQTDIYTSCKCVSLYYFETYFTCVSKSSFMYDTFV